MNPHIQMTTPDQLIAIVGLANDAATKLKDAAPSERSRWLRALALAIDLNADDLVAVADSETRLGTERLLGEVARTSSQLRMFASVLDEGAYLEAIVDDADPDAAPPRPELRRMLTSVGPVAVYAASNFPFAFSVVGGDTASALAAGSSVVVKAHSGHPLLSELTASIAIAALERAGAPSGSLSLIAGREAGNQLVQHPFVKAAGFTGSLSGGRALFDLASSRPDPIPFYGELGSTNPVVITAAAIEARADALAAGLVASFTLGAGQFCTKPGVVFIPRGKSFEDRVAGHLVEVPARSLLTDRITEAFPAGIGRLLADPSVSLVASGELGEGQKATPTLLLTDAASVSVRPEVLLEECFGPVTLLVTYASRDELHLALDALQGALTATVHSEPGEDVAAIVTLLEGKVGRLLFSGWPTGVAVTWSQHHGGPWPATTSLHTSVGATAIRRFLRPIVYQDSPEDLLPPVLRDGFLGGIPHRRNGVLQNLSVERSA